MWLRVSGCCPVPRFCRTPAQARKSGSKPTAATKSGKVWNAPIYFLIWCPAGNRPWIRQFNSVAGVRWIVRPITTASKAQCPARASASFDFCGKRSLNAGQTAPGRHPMPVGIARQPWRSDGTAFGWLVAGARGRLRKFAGPITLSEPSVSPRHQVPGGRYARAPVWPRRQSPCRRRRRGRPDSDGPDGLLRPRAPLGVGAMPSSEPGRRVRAPSFARPGTLRPTSAGWSCSF